MITVNKYLSVGDAALMLGVSVPTLRRWQKAGKIHESHRTLGNHRRFSIESLRALLGINADRMVVGYARVSSHDQKNDLATQAEFLRQQGCDEVIADLGSGMNCRKRGLIKLLRLIVSNQIERLVLTHHDRLLRFGNESVDVTVVHFKTEDGHLIRWDASKHISDVAEKINVGETYNFNGKVSRNFEANGEMITRIGGMRKFTHVNANQPTPTKKMNRPKP